VDSGTTDTYLPASITKKFKEHFHQFTGDIQFTLETIHLNAQQLKKLPDIVFVLEGVADGENVEVVMSWSDYTDSVGTDEYVFRIYLFESSGAVLGANFMNGYNIVFDADGQRLGFVPSDCKYEEFDSNRPGGDDVKDECDQKVAFTECSASCARNETAYVSVGVQDFEDPCNPEEMPESRSCSQNCSYFKEVRGDPRCPDKPWEDCNTNCTMTRQVVPPGEPLLNPDGMCNYKQQVRSCYAALCSVNDGDYLIYIDLRISLNSAHWGYVYTETFNEAFAQLFKVRSSSIDLLFSDSSSNNELIRNTKIHIELRLNAMDFSGVMAIRNEAERIIAIVEAPRFVDHIIDALQAASERFDGDRIIRFGWWKGGDVDITIISARAFPLGETCDKSGSSVVKDSSEWTKMDMVLMGVSLGALVMMLFVLVRYRGLKQEYQLIQKDKGSLRSVWQRFVDGNKSNSTSTNIDPKQVICEEEETCEVEMNSTYFLKNDNNDQL